MTRPVRLLAGLAVLLAAGCASAASGTAPVQVDRVDLPRSYLFAPADITVTAGTKVTWTNSDQFTHGIRLLSPTRRDVGTVRPGESVSHVFSAPGTYAYDCPFHPQNMRGTVTVK
ncbi:MAG TPA: plastocyanin/azurin family copper-binding protein [Candidatus Limnocylindria bacterium]|nr:plastocyanin/azurin family copper-binding protein [Candidatus Limnocylindria bacterium]